MKFTLSSIFNVTEINISVYILFLNNNERTKSDVHFNASLNKLKVGEFCGRGVWRSEFVTLPTVSGTRRY